MRQGGPTRHNGPMQNPSPRNLLAGVSLVFAAGCAPFGSLGNTRTQDQNPPPVAAGFALVTTTIDAVGSEPWAGEYRWYNRGIYRLAPVERPVSSYVSSPSFFKQIGQDTFALVDGRRGDNDGQATHYSYLIPFEAPEQPTITATVGDVGSPETIRYRPNQADIMVPSAYLFRFPEGATGDLKMAVAGDFHLTELAGTDSVTFSKTITYTSPPSLPAAPFLGMAARLATVSLAFRATTSGGPVAGISPANLTITDPSSVVVVRQLTEQATGSYVATCWLVSPPGTRLTRHQFTLSINNAATTVEKEF